MNKIFPLSFIDAFKISLLQKESTGRHWSLKETEKLLEEPEVHGWGIRKDSDFQGFILVRFVADIGDILDFVVMQKFRHQGLGQKLYDHLENVCRQKKVTELFLEVAASNKPAFHFYLKQGFKKVSTRSKYYSDGEDGFLMKKIVNL